MLKSDETDKTRVYHRHIVDGDEAHLSLPPLKVLQRRIPKRDPVHNSTCSVSDGDLEAAVDRLMLVKWVNGMLYVY